MIWVINACNLSVLCNIFKLEAPDNVNLTGTKEYSAPQRFFKNIFHCIFTDVKRQVPPMPAINSLLVYSQ